MTATRCGRPAGATPATSGRRSWARTKTCTSSSTSRTWSRSCAATTTTIWSTTRRGRHHRGSRAQAGPGRGQAVRSGCREELVAEKPTEESVADAGRRRWRSCRPSGRCASCRRCRSSSTAIRPWARYRGGIDHFTGKAGRKRWNAIAEIIGRSWDDVLKAIDDVVSTPEVDEKLSAKAAEELDEEPEGRGRRVGRRCDTDETDEDADEGSSRVRRLPTRTTTERRRR